MMFFKKSILVRTKGMNDFVKITDEVGNAVKESKIKNGMVFLNSLHNTAALIIQEDDPTIHRDLVNILEGIAPAKGNYEHNYEGDENATAHLKSNLLGSTVTIPLESGKLMLGTWQDIFLVELFVPRERKIIVTIMGE